MESGRFQISGLSGTLLSRNGGAPTTRVTVPGRNLLRVVTRGGDDLVAIGDLDIGRLIVRTGGGDDFLVLEDVAAARSVLVGGGGNDMIRVDRSILLDDTTSGFEVDSSTDEAEPEVTPPSDDAPAPGDDAPAPGDDAPAPEPENAPNPEPAPQLPNVVGLLVDGNNVAIIGSSGDDGIIIVGRSGGIQVTLARSTGNTFADGSTSQFVDLPDGLGALGLDLGDGNDGVFISGINADVVNADGGSGDDAITIRRSDIGTVDVPNVETVRQ